MLNEKLRLNKYVANAVGFSVAGVSNFFLNYAWTFSRKDLPVNYYFTTGIIADSLIKAGVPVTVLRSFPNFHVSQLNSAFLYKSSRSSQIDTTVIFEMNNKNFQLQDGSYPAFLFFN